MRRLNCERFKMAKKNDHEEIEENVDNGGFIPEDDEFDGPTMITMYDEDDNAFECELLGFVDYEDARYAIVCAEQDDESGIASVLKVKKNDSDDESAILETVDDEDLANAVFEKFKEEFAEGDYDEED